MAHALQPVFANRGESNVIKNTHQCCYIPDYQRLMFLILLHLLIDVALSPTFSILCSLHLKAVLQETQHHSDFPTLGYFKHLEHYESIDQWICLYCMWLSGLLQYKGNGLNFLVLLLQCFATRRSCKVPCSKVENSREINLWNTRSKHLLQTQPLLEQIFQATAYNNIYNQNT